jgi:hypothetical protein
MTRFLCLFHSIVQLVHTLLAFLVDGMRHLGLCLRSPAALAAENLFLRKQLALYQERGVKPKRVTPATRLALVWLARWFDWRLAAHRTQVPAHASGPRWTVTAFRFNAGARLSVTMRGRLSPVISAWWSPSPSAYSMYLLSWNT